MLTEKKISELRQQAEKEYSAIVFSDRYDRLCDARLLQLVYELGRKEAKEQDCKAELTDKMKQQLQRLRTKNPTLNMLDTDFMMFATSEHEELLDLTVFIAEHKDEYIEFVKELKAV